MNIKIVFEVYLDSLNILSKIWLLKEKRYKIICFIYSANVNGNFSAFYEIQTETLLHFFYDFSPKRKLYCIFMGGKRKLFCKNNRIFAGQGVELQ